MTSAARLNLPQIVTPWSSAELNPTPAHAMYGGKADPGADRSPVRRRLNGVPTSETLARHSAAAGPAIGYRGQSARRHSPGNLARRASQSAVPNGAENRICPTFQRR